MMRPIPPMRDASHRPHEYDRLTDEMISDAM
jgi:hypothetical protein